MLTHPVVWEALLERMPLTALVRNLGTMSKVGVLVPYSRAAKRVVERLGDKDALRAARVHPIALLAALKTYAQGHGMKGKNSWRPVPQVVDALDRAFYLAFRCVPTTGRRVMLALDVSGSMTSRVFGMAYLCCREASAAMALVTAATEPDHLFTAFTAGNHPSRCAGLLLPPPHNSPDLQSTAAPTCRCRSRRSVLAPAHAAARRGGRAGS